jgi:hypothetical protein
MSMATEQLSAKRAELAAILAEIADDYREQRLREVQIRESRRQRLLLLQRELAAAAGEEYAEPLPLDFAIGDEWHIISNLGRDPAVICGDVGKQTSHLIWFRDTHEFRVGTPQDEFEERALSGLDIYGLFIVRNSLWKKTAAEAAASSSLELRNWISGLEHFVLRNRTDLWCLAHGYEVRVVHQSIESLREAAGFWKQLK